jgi:dimethylhistidine N-methyltransferase
MAIASADLSLSVSLSDGCSVAASSDAAVEVSSDSSLSEIVREGLSSVPKRLPPWLFYDEAGSLLFEQITCLQEYYLTRLERSLLAAHAGEMIAAAGEGRRLRLVELGAGSADKTRTLLSAALARQGTVEYRPVDVSATALEAARERIEAELPGVSTVPVVADYTAAWEMPEEDGAIGPGATRDLLLWIGSSIGNFEPEAAVELLARINRAMRPGDGLLLGVDLAPEADDSAAVSDGAGCKRAEGLVAAYDDAAGVTAQFNCNMLVRLNRELGGDFDLDQFAHRAVWNSADSRMEMHLESLCDQWVRLESIDLDVHFAAGERLHTENSYKYTTGGIARLMERAGFPVVERWLAGEAGDSLGRGGTAQSGTANQGDMPWFAVLLGQKL